MSIFKKPNEREPKRTLSMMIYGMPSCGKTTLACSAPDAVLLDFEDGMHRVNYQFHIASMHPESWNDVQSALNELRCNDEVKSVIVDSVDRLMDAAMDHVRRTNPNLIQRDGNPSLKAYGVRKQLYVNFVKQLRDMGKNVVYVAHVVEERKKVGSDEVVFYRPNISKSNAPDITTDLDMEGYMFQDENGNRYVTFDKFGDIEVKNSCELHGKWDGQRRMYMPIPVPRIVDENNRATAANDYIARILDWNVKRIENERKTDQ